MSTTESCTILSSSESGLNLIILMVFHCFSHNSYGFFVISFSSLKMDDDILLFLFEKENKPVGSKDFLLLLVSTATELSVTIVTDPKLT